MSFVITLGIGTPGDIARFTLFGLSPNPIAVSVAYSWWAWNTFGESYRV